MENSTIGTYVTTVSALSRSALVYDIRRGNEDRCFFINHHTGVISTRRLLDFEVCLCFTSKVSSLPTFNVDRMIDTSFYDSTFTLCIILFLAANNILPSGGACLEHGWSGGQHHCHRPGGGCK